MLLMLMLFVFLIGCRLRMYLCVMSLFGFEYSIG